MFNSPIHYCGVCRAYVELDQGPSACARQHACVADPCPLRNLFREQTPSMTETRLIPQAPASRD